MDRDLAPCLECGANVPESAAACSTCGYNVAQHDRTRMILGGIGMALSLSVVLAPVGLPMLWRARRHRLAAEGSVTAHESRSVRAQLIETLRYHLDLSGSTGFGEGVFRGRGGSPENTVPHGSQ